jgi:hypothetical protein
MRKYIYILLTMFVCVVTLLPFFTFAYLKYNGLEDAAAQYDVIEELDTPSCMLAISLPSFEKIEDNGDICVTVLCSSGGCGFQSRHGNQLTTYASNDAARAELVAFAEKAQPADDNPDDAGEADEEPLEETAINYEYSLWQWLSILSIGITFSLLGIITSVVSRRGSSSGGNLAKDASGFTVVYFMSVASALVMISLFAGGFLQGSMFPNFSGDILNFGFNSWSALKFRGDDWFQLALWCYIAGFYERFIPDVLDQVMKRSADGAKEHASEQARTI